jgi:hypothetical protein
MCWIMYYQLLPPTSLFHKKQLRRMCNTSVAFLQQQVNLNRDTGLTSFCSKSNIANDDVAASNCKVVKRHYQKKFKGKRPTDNFTIPRAQYNNIKRNKVGGWQSSYDSIDKTVDPNCNVMKRSSQKCKNTNKNRLSGLRAPDNFIIFVKKLECGIKQRKISCSNQRQRDITML